MKEKEKKKIKISFGRILSNHFFILKIMHKSAPGFVAGFLFVDFLNNAAGIISNAYLLRFALNSINEGKTFKEIAVILTVWLVVRLVIAGISSMFYNYYSELQSVDMKRDIHSMLYKKASEVELGCYENPEYYNDFVKAIEECETQVDRVINGLLGCAYLITSFSGNFILVALIDPKLFLFALIPLITVPLRAKKNKMNYQKNMEMKEEKRRKDYSRRTFYLADYAKEMRLSNMPGLMLERFRESGERVIGIIGKYGFRIAAMEYVISECNELLSTLGAVMYTVWQTLGTGRMGFGDCIVIVNSFDYLAYDLTHTADVFLNFQENALYIENLRKFLDYEPKLQGGNRNVPKGGELRLENVSFRYDGSEKDVLSNISMRFGEREKVAIVGHNGAGKTTLVKLLLRLYDCEGAVTYDGINIKEFGLKEYRSLFSAVMQDFHVFALTAAENVLLRKRQEGDKARIEMALTKSGLMDKVRSFAKGVDTVMTKEFDESGELLSGGEQQKLAISHVYTRENRFVILDEPSSALDPIAEYEMYNRMVEACENCGMIFISHRLSSAVMADRIYFMEQGKVLEEGSHEELMKKNGRYAEMFRKQAENYVKGEGWDENEEAENRQA